MSGKGETGLHFSCFFLVRVLGGILAAFGSHFGSILGQKASQKTLCKKGEKTEAKKTAFWVKSPA